MSTSQKKSLIVRIARILAVLSVLLLLAAWQLPPFIRKMVMQRLHERIPPGDTLYYAGHTLRLLPPYLELEDLCWESPSSGISLSAARLEVVASWRDLLKGNGLKRVLLSEGELVFNPSPAKGGKEEETPDRDRLITIGDIRLRALSIRVQQNGEPIRFHIDSLGVALILRDSAGKWRIMPDTAALVLQVSGISVPDLFSHHRLDIATLSKQPSASWVASALAISSTRKKTFFDGLKHMAPRIGWQVDSMKFTWRLDTISGDRGVHLPVCLAQGHRLDIYQNTGLPPAKREKKLLPSLLEGIAFPFSLDTLQLDAGELVYEERTAADKPPARLTIDQWTLTASSVSNRRSGEDILLSSRMRLMKECILTASCRFPHRAPDDHFIFQGRLSPMNFTSLNELVGPVSGLCFARGRLHDGAFHFFGNNYHARGRMKLRYDDLRVSRYGRKHSGLFSWAAGLAVHRKGRDRESEIYAKRLPHRSMVHFWTRSIESGIKDHIIRWD